MNVFNLKAQVTLDTGEYKKGLKDAQSEAEKSSKKIGDSLTKTSEATQAQLKSIQQQYNVMLNSNASNLTGLDELLAKGAMNQQQYSKKYTEANEQFKQELQELINKAQEMGITFTNNKFQIVTAQKESTKETKTFTQQLEQLKQKYKQVAAQSQASLSIAKALFNNGSISAKQYSQIVGEVKNKQQNFLDEAKKMGVELPAEFDKAGKAMGEAANAAGGIWTELLAIIMKIANAIGKLVTESIEYSNEIYEVAKQYDMTTESVSQLQYIAGQTGTELSTITNAMTQLERKAASENEVFQELGVSITDANGNYKSMETVLFDTIGALNDLNDESEKSAYMSQLFGRTTMENGELFRMSAEEIANLRQESDALGITMSESTAELGASMTREMDALKLQGKSALAALLAGDENADELIQDFFNNALAIAEKFLPNIINFVLKGIQQLYLAIIRTLPQLVASFVSNIIGFFLDYIFSFDWIQFGVDWAKSILEGFINIFVSTINGLFGWLGVDIPKVDLGVGDNLFANTDTTTEYELSENRTEEVTIKLEASGDTAISKENAEETAKALAPYIDQILGAT